MRVTIILFFIYNILCIAKCYESTEVCYLKISPGTVINKTKSEHSAKYAYDLNKRKCVKFTYSGYGGNENRFESLNECMKTCDSTKLTLENYYKAARGALKQRKLEDRT